MSHRSELIATDIDAYLAEHERKELLRFITCGSVDDGKSTLIGRLFYDSKMIYEDQLAAIQRDSLTHGTTGGSFDPAPSPPSWPGLSRPSTSFSFLRNPTRPKVTGLAVPNKKARGWPGQARP